MTWLKSATRYPASGLVMRTPEMARCLRCRRYDWWPAVEMQDGLRKCICSYLGLAGDLASPNDAVSRQPEGLLAIDAEALKRARIEKHVLQIQPIETFLLFLGHCGELHIAPARFFHPTLGCGAVVFRQRCLPDFDPPFQHRLLCVCQAVPLIEVHRARWIGTTGHSQ